MSATYTLTASLNNGEISPYAIRRADVDFWQRSAAVVTNFEVLTFGGLRRTSGSRFITEVYDSAHVSRLFPFIFNDEQAYVIEMSGDGEIRFLADRAVLEISPSVDYTLSHSYAEADLARLSWSQYTDVADIAHQDYAPTELVRNADTDWDWNDAEFSDGPYLDINKASTTLTPAARGSVIDSTPGTASDSFGSSAAQVNHAFDQSEDASDVYQLSGPASPGWVLYTFDSAATRVVDGYMIQAYVHEAESCIYSWVMEGFDGTSYVTLDRQDGIVFERAERKHFEVDNDTAYRGYRISWVAIGNNSTSPPLNVQNIDFHEKASEQTAFNLTASAITGINNDTGFQTTDVGRQIRLFGGDGTWRFVEIVARTSTTVVTVRLSGNVLPDLSPIPRWRLGAFSTSSGFPACTQLYKERRTYANTGEKPLSVFGSQQGDFDDFELNDPKLDTDGISITMLANQMNEILWLVDNEDLICGSSKQVRAVGPADLTQDFSATNITQRKGPTSGATYHQPLEIGGAVIYVGKGGKKLRELLPTGNGRYEAPELSKISSHMLVTGVREWAFSEQPDPTIHIVTNGGEIISVRYDRSQKLVGFYRQTFSGVVESIAVIPSLTDGFDDIYIIVRRTINGATKRHIEVIEHPFDPDYQVLEDEACFVDSALSYDGAPTSTVTGATHLIGEDVVALADGSPMRDLTVDGSGNVALTRAASKVTLGLAKKSILETLGINGPGRDGSLFGRRMIATAVKVDFYKTASMLAGPVNLNSNIPDYYEECLRSEGGAMFTIGAELVSGWRDVTIEGDWIESEGAVHFETDEPMPAVIRAVQLQLETEP